MSDEENSLILSASEANQVRLDISCNLSFWEEIGNIPEEHYEQMKGNILLLPEGEHSEYFAELDSIGRGSPPRAVVGEKRKEREETPEEKQREDPPSEEEEALQKGMPVPPTERPCYKHSTADRIDKRKLKELDTKEGIAKLQDMTDPNYRITKVSFVCTLDSVPEYTDDEGSQSDSEGCNRCVSIPQHQSGTLLVLCTEYLNYTPLPWLETVVADGAIAQSLVLSVNGQPIPVPCNWIEPETPMVRHKTYTFAEIPVQEEGSGYLTVQFPCAQSPWRACLVGVLAERVEYHEYAEIVRGRDASPQQQWPALLSNDCEGDVVEASVSLKCPLTQVRMTIPARGMSCNHVECFNLTSYLELCCGRHIWSCPICNKELPPTALLVDPLLQEIISSCEVSDIWLQPNGTWKLPEIKRKSEVEIIELE